MLAPNSPRRYARTTRSYRVSILLSCFSLLGLAALTGCGSGGGGNNNNNPPPGGNSGEINGTVTDAGGAPLVGAAVRFGTQSTTSTQYGSYIISDVSVPSGQTSVVGNVIATANVNGVAYSGQNQVEVLSTDTLTRNAQIVMSPTATQGSIIGVVLDSAGARVSGARVFANAGPVTSTNGDGSTSQFFLNLAPFNTTTRSDGGFTLPAIPPGTQYTVTASFAGKLNQTVSGIVVQSATSTSVTLTLGNSTGSSVLTPPTGLFVQAITAPINPTRAAGDNAGFMNVIRQYLLKRRGLLSRRSASSQKITLKRSTTRATPSGSLIEADLFWDYNQQDNILGFDIIRATRVSPSANFAPIALVRDPQADRFADNDSILTPDSPYFYSIASLDTINFPQGIVDVENNIGESRPASPVQIIPLNALSLTSPASGRTVSSSTPTFQWNAVNRAALYKVLVYAQFPTLQSDTDPNGVSPIWFLDVTGTSTIYNGPALVSGHTYYWAVLGQDSTDPNLASAFTISPLQTFVAP